MRRLVARHVGDRLTLAGGVKMPWLGLGLFQMRDGEEVKQAVKEALKVGYRHIDTATLYENERSAGEAVREADVPREEIFVATKVWNTDQGYASTLSAFEASRKRLGLAYVDLYLVHWPVPGKYKETWRALEKLYRDGLVRAIGVCNFQVHHLLDLLTDAEVSPMVNQVECHPLLAQAELGKFCRGRGIQMEAWRPIMRGKLDLPVLLALAEKYGKTPAQVVLRWHLQREVAVIPKSVQAARIRENAGLFDFTLDGQDMEKIAELDAGKRFGPDPDHVSS